jgi:hypothetical protein
MLAVNIPTTNFTQDITILLRNGFSIRISEFLLYILVIPYVLYITIYLKTLSVSQAMQPELYRICLAET